MKSGVVVVQKQFCAQTVCERNNYFYSLCFQIMLFHINVLLVVQPSVILVFCKVKVCSRCQLSRYISETFLR